MQTKPAFCNDAMNALVASVICQRVASRSTVPWNPSSASLPQHPRLDRRVVSSVANQKSLAIGTLERQTMTVKPKKRRIRWTRMQRRWTPQEGDAGEKRTEAAAGATCALTEHTDLDCKLPHEAKCCRSRGARCVKRADEVVAVREQQRGSLMTSRREREHSEFQRCDSVPSEKSRAVLTMITEEAFLKQHVHRHCTRFFTSSSSFHWPCDPITHPVRCICPRQTGPQIGHEHALVLQELSGSTVELPIDPAPTLARFRSIDQQRDDRKVMP